jgi:hypothetical protein
MFVRATSWGARFALAVGFILSIATSTASFAAAIIVDNFSGTQQIGSRSLTVSQGGGMGTPPTFQQTSGWGVITFTPVNSIVSATLKYTPGGQSDLTGGGTNDQFLMEYVSVISDDNSGCIGCTQVANLQITIHTATGDRQKSGIGIGEGQVNQAIPLSTFTGAGDLTKVTSIDIAFVSVSNIKGGSVTIDRIWASPLAGAVPTAPGASFTPSPVTPTGSSPITFTLAFNSNQGAAPVTGLSASDFTLSGTAGATTKLLQETQGSTYHIAVSGMTGDGTVILSLPANTISDLWQQQGPTSLATSATIDYVKPPVFTNGPPPASVVYGTPYGPFTYTANGKAPIAFTIASGNLPPGMNLSSSGTIDGTPTATGTFAGTTRATNVGFTNQAFSITVTCPTISVGPTTLPDPTQFAAGYSQSLNASGIPGTYSFAVTAGALPAGMSLSSSGVLTGPATAKGPASFTVTATGPVGFACTGSRAYSFTVQAPTIAVSPASLPNGTYGVPYSQLITASGAPGPFSFAVTAGALPAGLTLSSAGTLSGPLTVAGTFNFTVTATDASNNTGSRAYSLTVQAPTITVSPASLPGGTHGTPYSQVITASGTPGPFTFTVTAGSLPPGLALSSAGTLSGPPTAGGTFNFTVTATEPGNNSGSRAYSVTIAASATTTTLTSAPNPSVFGQAVVLSATVTGVLGTPSGTVTFTDGGTNLGSGPVDGTGKATLSVSNLAVGPRSLQASFAGGVTYAASASAAATQNVNKAGTTLTLTPSANPASAGQAVTFTATVAAVAPGAGVPTGSVAYSDGATPLATVPLVAGVASFSTSALTAGSHSITGNYLGDAGFNASSDSKSVDVIVALTVAPTSLDFGGQSMHSTSPSQTLTLTNGSGIAIAVSLVQASTHFAVTHDCTTIAAGGSCAAVVTFTPEAEGAITGTVTVQAVGGGVSVPLAGVGERSQVTHYYLSILGRDPDPAGKAFWLSEIARLQALGANPNEAAFAMAMAFFSSPEYLALNRDAAGFVTDLYDAFFNRPPDPSGFAFWTGQLGAGLSRETVLASFMYSGEFTSFNAVLFGVPVVRAEVRAVVDLYRGLLARLPDNGGFQFWVQGLRAAQCQGAPAVRAQMDALSLAILGGSEYAGRVRTNAQYVGDLYDALLHRGGDLSGASFWIGQLDISGKNREQVRTDFMASAEMAAWVQAIAAQGCLP